MFDKKVTLKIPEERTTLKKRIGGREVLLYESMTEEEMIYTIQSCMSIYYDDNFTDNKDAFITPIELFANLDITVLQLCTNIDISNIRFEELCKLNIHTFLKNNIGGFALLEEAVLVGVQHIHTMKMLEGIDHIASIDEVQQTEENLKDMIENGVPENVRELMMAQIAENPGMVELFEKLVSMPKDNTDGLDE